MSGPRWAFDPGDASIEAALGASVVVEPQAPRQLESNYRPRVSWNRTAGSQIVFLMWQAGGGPEARPDGNLAGSGRHLSLRQAERHGRDGGGGELGVVQCR